MAREIYIEPETQLCLLDGVYTVDSYNGHLIDFDVIYDDGTEGTDRFTKENLERKLKDVDGKNYKVIWVGFPSL